MAGSGRHSTQPSSEHMRRESSINLAWALTIVCALYLPTARSAAQQYPQPGAPVSQWGGSPDTFSSPVPANLPYSTQGFGTAGTEHQRFFNASFLQEPEAGQRGSSESEEGGEEQEGEEIETPSLRQFA